LVICLERDRFAYGRGDAPVIQIGFTCLVLPFSTGHNANLELVDKFCYLGDMLIVDRDADAAVETRIRIGWNKFRQLVPHL